MYQLPRSWLLLTAFAAAVGTAVWFWLTAGESRDTRSMYGLWRMRYFLVGCAGVWLALFLFAGAASRKLMSAMFQGSIVLGITWVLLEVAGVSGLVSYPDLFGRGGGGEVLGQRPVPNVEIAGRSHQDTATRWGLPTEPISFRYETDRRGFRNAEDRAAADLYLLGDSFLVAGLVPFSKTITVRLERALNRPTMNLSLIGLSVQEERNLLKEQDLLLKGRMLIQFVFEGNDLADSAVFRSRRDAPEDGGDADADAGSGPSLKDRTFLYNVMMELQRWSDPVHPIARRRIGYIDDQWYTFRWTRKEMRGRSEQTPHLLAALGDVQRLVREAGGAYAVVLIPAKLRVLGPLCRWPEGSDLEDYRSHLSDLPGELREWADAHGVPLLDLTEPLIAAARSGRIPWYHGGTHWNATGHAVAAQAVREWDAVQEWDRAATVASE